MAEKDLKALFLHQLKDTYFAENAILKALPQMAEAAESEEPRGAFTVHLEADFQNSPEEYVGQSHSCSAVIRVPATFYTLSDWHHVSLAALVHRQKEVF